jgi:hypothetical protein
MKTTIIGAAMMLCLPLAAVAQQNEQQQPKVTPGTDATQQMGKEVPPMKGCPEKAPVDSKAPGTQATEAMDKNVPTMTSENKDCPPDGEQKTKKN